MQEARTMYLLWAYVLLARIRFVLLRSKPLVQVTEWIAFLSAHGCLKEIFWWNQKIGTETWVLLRSVLGGQSKSIFVLGLKSNSFWWNQNAWKAAGRVFGWTWTFEWIREDWVHVKSHLGTIWTVLWLKAKLQECVRENTTPLVCLWVCV